VLSFGSGGGNPDTNGAPNNFEDRTGPLGPTGGPASIGAQACTINEYIVGTCDDWGYVASAGLLGRMGAQAAGSAGVAWYISKVDPIVKTSFGPQ
jgi:hypothetical protein